MLRPVFDIDLKDSRKEGTPVLLLTIWLGANDAVLSPSPAHVPLPKYVANLRHFVDSALREPVFEHATIVIISPPPIDVTGTDLDEADYIPQLRGKSEDEKLKGLREITRSNIGHRTYLSKRLYARKAMEVAREYERLTTEDNANATPRVFGLDFWSFLTADELCERGWETSADQVDQMDAEQLPGCGMPMVGGFRDEVFTDGLHLDEKVMLLFCSPQSNMLSRQRTIKLTNVTKTGLCSIDQRTGQVDCR